MKVETLHYKGHAIDIFWDEYPENPRAWDNLGTMVCFHNNYDLGDKHNFYDSDDLIEYIENNKVIALSLYLYDHSGITMNTCGFSCPWDSGQVGIIYIDYETIKNEYNWKYITKKRIGKIKSYLCSEVEIYDDYLTGNVYWYKTDINDSCGGFYGSDFENNGLLEYAKNAIDCHIKQVKQQNNKQLKQWIKSKTPIIYRQTLNYA